MLCSMAIRMKEWGMQAYPRQGVHLPLNALNDWGRTGRALGQGVAAAGQGLAALAPAIEQVARTGRSADAAAMLDEIGRETVEELLDLPVRDWDYSWQQAYAPRVHEMLNEFSGGERDEALRLSELYGEKYSLEGRRSMELERLHQAKSHWRRQVDTAVQSGDADSARQWVEQGRGVFVPESEMPQELEAVQSRSLLSRWQQHLLQDPHTALAEWQSPTALKPAGQAELSALEKEMQKTRAGLFDQLAVQLGASLEQGDEPDAGQLERAVAAGVLAPEQLALLQQPRTALSVAESCNWFRRIDERAEADDARLVVDIALAPLPVEQKQVLLRRLQDTAAVPQQRRSRMSRALWNLYRAGRFGCPGDEEAMRCLGRLQEEALRGMNSWSEKDCERWLETFSRAGEDNWVCFE